MVVAQLAEPLLPASEDPGSNPAISNFRNEHSYTVNNLEKTKIQKKEAGKCHI